MRIAWILVPVAAVIALVAGYVVYTQPSQNAMPENDAMMEDDLMMKDDDAMMKKEEEAVTEGDAMIKNDDAMEDDDNAVMAKGSYTAYSADVLANGETKVLFFHAAWCPSCKKGDATLTAWYAADEYQRSVYKVDYDNSNDLKAKYGVTYQHTFVLVDGEGNALKVIQGPTDAQLLAMIQI